MRKYRGFHDALQIGAAIAASIDAALCNLNPT